MKKYITSRFFIHFFSAKIERSVRSVFAFLGVFSLFYAFLIFFSIKTTAQTNILERRVTLTINERPLKEALKQISKAADFYYSYNPSIVNDTRLVSLSAQNQTVRFALKTVFGADFQYKQFGNNLVIQKLKPREQIIGGYVSDEKTGKRLANVTIYDKKTLQSATTDSFGYYELRTRKPIGVLTIARKDYVDTNFVIKSVENDTELDISMLPTPDTLVKRTVDAELFFNKKPIKRDSNITEYTLLGDSDFSAFMKEYAKSFENADALNVNDESLRRQFQWSIAPYVGNNRGLSGSVVNKYAFNATVGYALGSRVFELGLVGNIARRNASGVQVAGIFNIVNRRHKGLQIAGLLNRAAELTGVQISSINNNTDTMKNALQVAGISNQADKILRGGYQVSGVSNLMRKGRSAVQISGISNRADTVFAQIGLINVANKARGFQIGLINLSDTASGVMLGLINVAKKGYNAAEVATDEFREVRLAFRTGTKWFHSIYGVGIQPIAAAETRIGHVALGIGTNISLMRRLYFTSEVVARQHRWVESLERLANSVRLGGGFAYRIFGKVDIGVSAHWNHFVTTPSVSATQLVLFEEKNLPASVSQRENVYRWWGGQVFVRFN